MLGSGGFASVWEIDGGVLKIAHADHELSRARIAREAEALGAIGSPYVPKLIEHGVLDGRGWIAMERVTGKPLSTVLEDGPLEARAHALSLRILEVLSAIHTAGFLHRDIKPDNLYVTPDGAIVALDLGLARKLPDDPDDPTRANVQVGSLEYMAPEQILTSPGIDQRADLYAFGCVIYELCSGRPPFVGDAAALSRAHVALRPPPLSALAPRVSHGLEGLAAACLAKDPAKRPASAADAHARLAASEDSASSTSRHMASIGSGRQPVVLLWAELAKVDRTVLSLLAARRAQTLSQRGRRVLAALVGADHADPAASGLLLGQELAAAGARVAIHLDSLAVDQAAKISGPAIDHPESWLPIGTWTGVALSRTMAAVTRLPTSAAPELGGGVRLLTNDDGKTPFVGRDAQIGDLLADAAAVLVAGRASPGPGLALVVGDAGVGKSAFVEQLARRVGELGARIHTGAVPPPGTGRPATSALAELLGELPAGPTVRVVGDALRAVARERPLAVFLDDLHHADAELLSAIEYATLGGEALPLWIVATVLPRFLDNRPDFGRRAERPRRDELPPLDEESAMTLAAALLRPAEYPPLRALRQLATIARGSPMHLGVLVRDLHERGAVRRRPNGEAFFDTSVLDTMAPVALGPWLATRATSGLAPEVVALARLCAVLGEDVDRNELADVIDAVERAGGATTMVDADVGLGELAGAGVVVRSASGWRFPQSLVCEGLYATTDEKDRTAVHRAALDVWWSRTTLATASAVTLSRIARHAEGAGDPDRAAQAFVALGELAHREHRTFDADAAWAGAVRNLGHRRDARLCRALIGLGRARYHIQRTEDAVIDLEAALEIARDLGDPQLEVEALLEEATALDIGNDAQRAGGIVAEAGHRLTAMPADAAAALNVELELALGRAEFRAGNLAGALAMFRDVIASPIAQPDTVMVARLMLAPLLVQVQRYDEARAEFQAAIDAARAAGDLFHLCGLHVNRTWLWTSLGDQQRAEDDNRVVIQLAREAGVVMMERAGTYNLAEGLLWVGDLSAAGDYAARSLTLQQRFGDGPATLDHVLLARIHAAGGNFAAAVAELPVDAELDDGQRVVRDAIQAASAHADVSVWDAILARATKLEPEQFLELAVLAAREHRLLGAIRDEVRALATRHPIWSRRVAEL